MHTVGKVLHEATKSPCTNIVNKSTYFSDSFFNKIQNSYKLYLLTKAMGLYTSNCQLNY